MNSKYKVDSRDFISSSDEDEVPVNQPQSKKLFGGIKVNRPGVESNHLTKDDK